MATRKKAGGRGKAFGLEANNIIIKSVNSSLALRLIDKL